MSRTLLHKNIDVDDTNKYQMKHHIFVTESSIIIPNVNANFLTTTFGMSLPYRVYTTPVSERCFIVHGEYEYVTVLAICNAWRIWVEVGIGRNL